MRPRTTNIADANGGGVTYEELKAYVEGKKRAFGVMIDRVLVRQKVAVDPKSLFEDLRLQSFLYLSPLHFQRVMHVMFPDEEHA